jgi:hypothetical protein
MEDRLAMGVAQGIGDHGDDPGCPLGVGAADGEPLPARRLVPDRLRRGPRTRDRLPETVGPGRPGGRIDPTDHLVQRGPGPIGHAQGPQTGFLIVGDREDRHDAGVVQPSLDRGLDPPVGRELQGDLASAQFLVPGEEDLARSPLAQHPAELEGAEAIAGHGHPPRGRACPFGPADQVVAAQLLPQGVAPRAEPVAERVRVERLARLLAEAIFLVGDADEAILRPEQGGKRSR